MAQEPKPAKPSPQRYGIDLDLNVYPQKTPKECLESVLRAIERQRIDYLLAHLTDPQFVDARVQSLGGNFKDLIQETMSHLADNPKTVKELKRIFQEGEWTEAEETATVKLKDVKDRAVFLRKMNERWFLENRKK